MPGRRGESCQDRADRERGLRKRTFLVVGPRTVQGKAEGETVELEFHEDVIVALVNGGFVREVFDKNPSVEVALPAPRKTPRTRS